MPPPPLPPPPSALPPTYLREYDSDTLRNISYAFKFFVIAVVALRFYARSLSKSSVGIEDILVLPAATCCIGICILSLVGT